MSLSAPAQATQSINVQYLLLVRHGSRDNAHDVHRHFTHLENLDEPKKLHGYSVADRTKPGWPRSQSLAGWVSEFLHLWNVKVTRVVTSPALDAQETAHAYLSSFQPQNLCPDDVSVETNAGLHTNFAVHPTDRLLARQPLECVRICPSAEQGKGAGKALLLCGHQPHLTWIANGWLRRKDPVPLNLSEALLIRLAPSPQALWVVGAEDPEAQTRLRDKIKSKLDIAKWFSAFISLVLGLVVGVPRTLGVNDIVKHPTACSIGFMLILGSLFLTLMTLFAYDTLQMPKLFWIEGPRRIWRELPQFLSRRIPGWRLERPPTPVHWVLYSNMVRVWFLLFRPAVGLYVIGVSFVACSVFDPVHWPLVALGGVTAVGLLLQILARVRLGSQD
ncbi:MAG: hypothetical protein KAY37_01395 [Phycisphaerae bacterium]|nr:hypothetical protein [Phycisphaerae bacterium]